ncbi:protein-L-IsoD(D-D) O-methyltransferase [Bacillus sp. HMF5848]|uniref:class I SAM-dependent methyltransferase n=1 Tax=Bacillus sp. HMF5848 TaxID=2495421 RepID=UPI000F7A7532|nr:class I SAM-dependent methyltransferase [Bacillus sp. HMF5848]RSK27307.1 protein-L-IsoD(D-D) O-methyltransferase [Bacillus sp. HMF5848]
MIVTTSQRTNDTIIAYAHRIAEAFKVKYVPRNKESLKKIQDFYNDDVFVVSKERFELYSKTSDQPFFFHPSSAMFRIKRLISGGHDSFICAARIERNMSVLDCTLGLGSDSIVAAYVTGERGTVTGIEKNSVIAFIVREGFKTWSDGVPVIQESMRSIEVVNSDNLDFLKNSPSNSYDVVYFDPMFETLIEGSVGIEGLKSFASYNDLTHDHIIEAKRVARHRVVLKDHWKSNRFELLGFKVQKRPTSLFHYGTIDLI